MLLLWLKFSCPYGKSFTTLSIFSYFTASFYLVQHIYEDALDWQILHVLCKRHKLMQSSATTGIKVSLNPNILFVYISLKSHYILKCRSIMKLFHINKYLVEMPIMTGTINLIVAAGRERGWARAAG